MKKLKYLLVLIIPFVINSCNDNDIEVIRFDDSFTPKSATPGKRDTPPPVDLLHTYAFFSEQNQSADFMKMGEGDATTISGSDKIEIKVNLNKKAEKEIPYNLSISSDWLNGKSERVLPQEAYTIRTTPIVVGGKGSIANIIINKDALKNLEEGVYYLPIEFKFNDEKIRTLKGYDLIVLKVKITKGLPQGDNVEVINDLDGNVLKGSFLTFTSDEYSKYLPKLNDGDVSNSSYWLISSSSNKPLEIGLGETKKVKGIVFKSYKGGYYMKSVDVFVSNDDGANYVDQGQATVTGTPDTINVSFKTPVSINKIKLVNFKGSDSYVVFTEIELRSED